MIIKEEPMIKLIMEDKIYYTLIESIKNGQADLFVKTLVDFYDSSDEVYMPSCILLKDYLRYHTNTEYNKLVRRKDGKDIYLHKNDYESPFHMEYFVRRHSKGYYLYKNRVFRLTNQKSWCGYGDGYYKYTPYFEKVVNLDTITTI